MISRINTILIIGGTSGIGEQYARRFHEMGKKVIIAGRNDAKLSALANELSGLETIKWDITDLYGLDSQVKSILEKHPQLDTIFLNAGIQKSFSFLEPAQSSTESIKTEIDSNLTAPIILSRLFVPHLASLAEAGKQTNLLITSSSLAYFPLGFYPIYCPTKAAIHAFCVVLRQQINFADSEVKKNLNIVEIVPPYTDTGLDSEHRAVVLEMQGGPEHAFPAIALDDYMTQSFASLEEVDDDGNFKKEVGVGFGQVGVDKWRGTVGKDLNDAGINC